MLTEYYMSAPDVMVMVIALSSLTMWRKQYRHSPYSLLKISFCFHLFTNTELSTYNSMSVTTALERFLYLLPKLLVPSGMTLLSVVFKTCCGHFGCDCS